MHFIVRTEDINHALSMTLKAVSVRPVKQVYEGILIEGDGDGLMLTGTDGDITIRVRIPATIKEDGHILLPGKLFGDLMRYQPQGEVEMKVDESGRARIKSEGTESNMVSMDDDDYPEIDDIQGGNVVYAASGKLRDAIGRVMFAVSTDESRKILTGILTEIYQNEIVLEGLDGFRLAMQTIVQENKLPEKKDKLSCVIPGRIMNEIKSMLPDDDDVDAELVFSGTRCMFSFGEVRVYASLLTGEFIDYQRILPKSWTTQVIAQRGALSNAVDRCSLMAREGKNNLIHFSIKNTGILKMNAKAEKGDVQDEMSVKFEGNELDIAFNSKYLLDVIHNVNTDEICMCFNTNVSPCLIKPIEGHAYTFLLLPVRIFGR